MNESSLKGAPHCDAPTDTTRLERPMEPLSGGCEALATLTWAAGNGPVIGPRAPLRCRPSAMPLGLWEGDSAALTAYRAAIGVPYLEELLEADGGPSP